MIRVAMVLFYFLVTLHKLNCDFLRPDAGAAAGLFRAHATAWPFLPQGPAMDAAAIYGTLVVEGGIGLLLAIPATRGIGIIIGALFHLVLSYNPVQHYYNFSAMIFAAYFMFAPQRITLVLNSWADKYSRRLLRVAITS